MPLSNSQYNAIMRMYEEKHGALAGGDDDL